MMIIVGTSSVEEYTILFASLIYSWNEKCRRQTLYSKSKHTFYVQ